MSIQSHDHLRFSIVHPVSIPPAGFVDFYFDQTLGRMVRQSSDGLIHSPEIPDAEPAQWGNIIGTLSAQTDLQSALDLKFNKLGGAITGNVSISLVLQTQGLLVSDTVNFAATTWAYSGGPTGAAATAHKAALGIAESSGGAAWGGITGTLGDQADLGAALAGKAPTTAPTFNGTANFNGKAIFESGFNAYGNCSFEYPVTFTNTVNVNTGMVFGASATFAYDPVSLAQHKSVLGITTSVRSNSTTSDTLVLEDRYVRYTGAGDVTVTVPNDAQLDIPTGTKITLRQVGQGTVLVAEGPGVTVHGQLSTAGRHRSLGLIKVGPNEWDTERGAF